MIVLGKFALNEVNVAFHFMRMSVWEPWETIGVYVTHHVMARAKYLSEYDRITKQFAFEVEDAAHGAVWGSAEFLEMWRADYQDATSVIGPIINYCTTQRDFPELLSNLYTRYVGNNSANVFARMAIMLKQRDHYFPVTTTPNGLHQELKELLREAQLV